MKIGILSIGLWLCLFIQGGAAARGSKSKGADNRKPPARPIMPMGMDGHMGRPSLPTHSNGVPAVAGRPPRVPDSSESEDTPAAPVARRRTTGAHEPNPGSSFTLTMPDWMNILPDDTEEGLQQHTFMYWLSKFMRDHYDHLSLAMQHDLIRMFQFANGGGKLMRS